MPRKFWLKNQNRKIFQRAIASTGFPILAFSLYPLFCAGKYRKLRNNIGVKRNAERYKFWEPRLRVDPVWARSRRSRFSICNAQPDVNFLVTFAKRRTFGPKIAFWAYYWIFGPQTQFWGPKRTFGSKIDFGPKRPPFLLKFHWLYKHPRHEDTKTHFHTKTNF